MSTVNSITVTNTSDISVVTAGTQGVAGPNTILGRSVVDSTVSTAGSLLVYDHSNTQWVDSQATAAQSLTAKLYNLQFTSGGATVTQIYDEDNLGSDSNTGLATQQSIKAYVDAQNAAQDVDYQGDTGGTQSVTINSEVLTIAGGTGIGTVGSSNTITINIDNTVVTLTGSQTLTNKTLTSPVINTGDINNPDLDGGTITGSAIDNSVIGANTAAAITGTAITGTSFVIGSATITEAELEILDGATLSTTEINYLDGTLLGSAVAGKVVAVDAQKDIAGLRNVTLSGVLNAASLDISGDADIDGTLEADAITVNGTALAEVISDTVGAMVSSNTESGITVTYEDSDNTLDFNVNDPVITLSGDVAGSATMTNLGDVTISTTIQANSIALGTDTTGNYVATVAASNTGIDVANSGSESAAVTLGLNTEHVQDLVGAMFSSNTESGITATYQDADGTIDFNTDDFTVTLAGDLSGSVTITDLASATLTATIVANSVALGTDTTGNYIATIAAGEGIDVSGSGSETAAVTISAEDATDSNKGIASFDSTDFAVSSGAVTLVAERIQDIVGAMLSSNTESGISVTYQDSDGTIDFDVDDFTISLTGDVVGSGTVTNAGNVSFATTIQANSVALGTDTTGNYVATIADAGDGTITVANSGSETAAVTLDVADDSIGNNHIKNNAVTLGTQSTGNYVATIAGTSNEITVSGSGSETAAVTISLPDDVTIGNDLTVTNDLVVTGDLTVNGDTVTLNTATLDVEDATIRVAKGASSLSATNGAGIEFGASTSKPTITWDNGNSRLSSNKTFYAASLVGALTGNASTATTLETTRAIALSGDVVGTANFDGSAGISISTTIQANSVALGTDTTGNYLATLAAANAGIDVANSGAETAAVTVGLNTEYVQDLIGAMLTGNTETGITVTYQDGDGTVDFVLSAAQPTITSLGTLTTLTVDDITINGSTISDASDLTLDAGGNLLVDVDGGIVRFYDDGTEWAQFKSSSQDIQIISIVDDKDIIFRGSDAGTYFNALTIDMSEAGAAIFNSKITAVGTSVFTNLDISGDVDIDGTLETDALTIGGVTLSETIADTVGAMVGSNTETGITVTYEDSDNTLDFVIGSGVITNGMLAGSIANSKLANSTITVSDGSNTTAVALGGTITYAAGEGLDVAESSGTVTFSAEDATSSNKGVASFTNHFSVSSGAVSLASTGVSAASYGSSTAIPVITIDAQGRITAASTASINTNFTLAADSGSNDTFSTGGTLTFTGGEGIDTTVSDDTITIAAELATETNAGVATFDGTDFSVSSGDVTINVERIADIVGSMVTSNTETGITVTYEDSDNTLDFAIGTLNQNTTGNAATATKVYAGDSDGNGNYRLIWTTGTSSGNQDLYHTGGVTLNASTDKLTATGGFAGDLTGTILTAAQTNITSLGTLGSLAVTGDVTVNTNVLKVDTSNNRVGVRTATPSYSLDAGSATDAFYVPKGTTAQRPSAAAGLFRYNTTLGRFEGYTDAWGEIGGGGSNTYTVNNYTTSNNSTTAFTLSQTPNSEDNLQVFVGGVFQNPNDYTLNGTTLTLDEAPPSGTRIVVYSVRAAVSGSNLNHDQFTASGSATFGLSIAPVSENNTMAFIDGVYQQKTDYSISGQNLVFDTAPTSGAVVEVMTFTQTDINVPVNDTIATAHIKDANVTLAKMAANSVDSDQYVDGSIDAAHLSANVISGLTEVTPVSGDKMMILDATDSALKKADVNEIMAAAVSVTSAADAVALQFDSNENATFTGQIDVKGVAARPTSLAEFDTAFTARFRADGSNNDSLYIAEASSGMIIQTNDGATNSSTAKPLSINPHGGAVSVGAETTFSNSIALGGATVANGYQLEIDASSSGNIWRSTRGTSVLAAYQSNNSHAYLGTTSNNEFRIIQNDGVAITVDTSKNVTVAADLQAAGLYVGSTNTSYDFYNNGTSYLNGAVIVDDDLTSNKYILAGGSQIGQDYAYLKSNSTSNTSLTLRKDASGADAIDFLQLRTNSNGLVSKITGAGVGHFTGAEITGTTNIAGGVNINGAHLNLDAGYSIQWNDSHERIEQSDGHLEFFVNNGESMTLDTDGLGVGTTDPAVRLHLKDTGSTSATEEMLRLENHALGGTGAGSSINFHHYHAGSGPSGGAKAAVISSVNSGSWTGGTPSSYSTDLAFSTIHENSFAERFRIKSDGNALLSGGTNNEVYMDIFSDSGSNRGAGYFRFLTDGASDEQSVAQIYMEQGSGDGGSRKSNMYFQVADNGAPSTAMTIENNKIVSTATNLNVATTSTATNAKLNVAGGIRFTHSPASAAGFNVVSNLSFNNTDVDNACGSVYYKMFILNLYHNNGHSQALFLANGGGGVGYRFTSINAGDNTIRNGVQDFNLTTIGSSPNTFRIQISNGGGALTVRRTSGTGSFQVAVQVLTGG